MAVYVDPIKAYPGVTGQAKRWGIHWCHMCADTHDELMAFAIRLGMNPAWLQHPGRCTEHFDLLPTKRAQAIRLGAHEKTGRELGHIMAGKMPQAAEAARREGEME